MVKIMNVKFVVLLRHSLTANVLRQWIDEYNELVNLAQLKSESESF